MPWRQFVAAGVYWTIYAVTLRRIDWGQSIYTEFPYIWPLRHPRFWNPRYHSMCDLFCRFFRASCCVVPLVVGGLSDLKAQGCLSGRWSSGRRRLVERPSIRRPIMRAGIID